MPQKSLKIYTLQEFTAADRIDRIQMHIMEPKRFILTLTEEEYWRKLQQAYHLCYDELRQSEAIKKIQESVYDCETWYKANRVYADMTAVFGQFVQKNAEFRRQIAVEKLYFFAKKAEDDDDWQLAASIIEKAAKLEGLDKIQPGFTADDINLPDIEVTSDAEVLRIAEETWEEADLEDED